MRSDCANHDGVTQGRRISRGLVGLGALALAVLTAAPVRAQNSGNGFMFNTPTSTLTFRTGYDYAFANSDLFSYARGDFTLGHADFSSPTLDADLGFRMSPQVDAVFGLGYSHSAVQSEYRDWLDNNNLPIQQSTELTRVPLTVSLKAYLSPRGTSAGHFAWIPAKFVPYVGAGVGTMWYKFRQGGDFINFQTTNVYSDQLTTSAWTPMADAFIGGEWSVRPAMAFTADARYSWAQAPVKGDFSGFHRADLSGLAVTAGLTFRF
jgi:hypothetical protein